MEQRHETILGTFPSRILIIEHESEIMSLPFPLDHLRRAPGMYLRHATFNELTAYLLGYNCVCQGGFLIGFREWLVVQLDGCDSQAWTELVPKLAFQRGILRRSSDGDADWEASAIEAVLVILEEFLFGQKAHNGPRRIFVEYDQWLRRQDWYDDSVHGFQR